MPFISVLDSILQFTWPERIKRVFLVMWSILYGSESGSCQKF